MTTFTLCLQKIVCFNTILNTNDVWKDLIDFQNESVVGKLGDVTKDPPPLF